MSTGDLAIPLWFAALAVICVCGSALWKGQWEERIVGAAIIAAWVLNLLFRVKYHGLQWTGLAITSVNLVLFSFIAFRSYKFWPLWLAGFQLLAFITHIARLLDQTVGAWAYISAGIIWTYLQFGALGVGTLGVVLRRKASALEG